MMRTIELLLIAAFLGFLVFLGMPQNEQVERRDSLTTEYFPIETKGMEWGLSPENVTALIGTPDNYQEEFSTTTLTYEGIDTLYGNCKAELVFCSDNLVLGDVETGELGLVIVKLEITNIDYDTVREILYEKYGSLIERSNQMLNQIASGASEDGITMKTSVYSDDKYILANIFKEDELSEIMKKYTKWTRQPISVLQKQSLIPITVFQSGEKTVHIEFRALDLVVLHKAGII